MTDNQIIQFSFTVDDPELDDEDRHAIALQLLPQLKQIDEVESVERTEVKDPQAGSKVGLETLIGFLTQAPVNDPELEYRREVEKWVKRGQGKISAIGHHALREFAL